MKYLLAAALAAGSLVSVSAAQAHRHWHHHHHHHGMMTDRRDGMDRGHMDNRMGDNRPH